jgi:phosphoribosylamine--glycine ligase
VITGLDAAARDRVLIFHAGTAVRDGDVVTAGGRVLNVVGLGPIDEARDLAYRAVDAVDFQGKHFRRDIGVRGRRLGALGGVALAAPVKEPHR